MINKKIKKNIKIFTLIIVMSAFILPSYAALSASDGSSFVTMAEFDSAVVNLNSRLKNFEDGVNDKIDTQVSAFLDRNGMWNAAEQNIIKFNSLDYDLNFPRLAAKMGGWCDNIAGKGADGYKYWSLNVYKHRLVKSISKSGLCYFTYQNKIVANYPLENQNPTGGVAPWPLIEGSFLSVFDISQYDEVNGDETPVTSINFFALNNGYYYTDSLSLAWIKFSMDTNIHSAMFFVEANKSLDVAWNMYYTGSLATFPTGNWNQGASGYVYGSSNEALSKYVTDGEGTWDKYPLPIDFTVSVY